MESGLGGTFDCLFRTRAVRKRIGTHASRRYLGPQKRGERKTWNRVAAISFYLARAPEESVAPVNHAGNYGKGVKAVKNEPDSSINIPTSMTAAEATGTTLYSLLSVSIGVADVRFYSRRSVIRLPGTHLGHVGRSDDIKTDRRDRPLTRLVN